MAPTSQGDLKQEEKVNLAIEMTDACIRVCAEGIRDRNPAITEEELLEELRERIAYTRRPVNEE